MKTVTRNALLTVLLAGVLPAGATRAEGFRADPQAACAYLNEQGLPTRGGYREVGSVHQCWSRRKNVIGGGEVHNTVRYLAEGDAGTVRRLELELQVHSLTAVQRAHRILSDHARALFKAALDQDLPDGVEAAILSAVSGSWTVNGYAVTLERIDLGGPGYDLRFRIQ